jgi:hypothetical protein
MTKLPVLRTPRLLLIPATPATLAAELVSPAALGGALGVDVSPNWPPELYDADAVRWTLNALESGSCPPDWCLYYFAEFAEPPARSTLIGVGGFRGGPTADGTVEIGYGVVPESRRRGFAREAVDGLSAGRSAILAYRGSSPYTASPRAVDRRGDVGRVFVCRTSADAGGPDAINTRSAAPSSRPARPTAI